MERRLTAILSADVVGYSRLMGEDEGGTLERLKACRRNLVDPAIAEFHGRIIKLMGDGALVEFASVVDAVQCAAIIQRKMASHDPNTSDEKRIQFRIGVNLGDIIVEGDDIYGDGVNIAARLEGLAQPGGICISGTAFDHAVHKADVGFSSLGEQRLKNIADPVRAYSVLLDPPGGQGRRGPSARTSGYDPDNTRNAHNRGHLDCRRMATAVCTATPIDRGAAIHKFEWRPKPRLFYRWHHRQPDLRSRQTF